ncbi:MAG: hypothetical protein DRI57_08280 [Deltaproteobacteria bacterium]|nr:MAG: hypothetical protein DRI57_08280 [Deltaproteobacteria bacterium]
MNTGMSEELSITEGNHALQNFTDRDEFIRRFAEYLNDEQTREKILFFQGEGGKGKSLLLKFLQKTCCKRFFSEKWENLKNMQPKEFAEKMKNDSETGIRQNDYTAIPASLLDFGQQPRGEAQPQDPFYGLLMLRWNIGAPK